MNILIVDDDEKNIKVLEGMLKPQNYCLLKALNGETALDILQQKDTDMVILDIILPGISGLDVLKEIRRNEKLKLLPVILISALSEREDRIKGLECGADDYISKPFDQTELITRITTQLKLSSLRNKFLENERNLNNELRNMISRLENANKELEAFSFSASHDLHAPLRIIGEFSKILLEEHSGNLNKEGKRILGIISHNTNLMQELIDDLLILSQTDIKEMRKQKINMTQLAKSVVKEQKGFLKDTREVTFVFKELAPAFGDEKLIRQVFVNLLSNAVKFTGENPKAVIEVGSNKKGNEFIYYVKDNGVGFDMRKINMMFTAFKRLHSQDQFPGSGIGLTIVKRVIERHGGSVWAQGKVNEGAVFYFTLPAGE